MLRTQIYLPAGDHEELCSLAKKLNISMGETIRNILKKGLKKEKKIAKSGNDLWKLGELKLKGGPKDLSGKLDTYLYQ